MRQNSDLRALAVGFARDSLIHQPSHEDLQYDCKRKCYPKLKKDRKDDVKSQKSQRRVEGRNV